MTEATVTKFLRITHNPQVMGGKPCIRGLRVTVGMIAGQISAGATIEEMIADFSYLTREDILDAVEYAKLYIRKVKCPCCGAETLDSANQYEVCDKCNWEDDPAQSKNPDSIVGFNILSLNQAKAAIARGEKLPLPRNVEIIEIKKRNEI